ncbi:MAG: hypothetical protein E6K13_00440 [Methanobacteriota archaeon]|nr:MAG: hypothetical protein E6K13_00440 [Euryarchaeota archaeon]
MKRSSRAWKKRGKMRWKWRKKRMRRRKREQKLRARTRHSEKRAGSRPAWWKPADLGSNPSVPTPPCPVDLRQTQAWLPLS